METLGIFKDISSKRLDFGTFAKALQTVFNEHISNEDTIMLIYRCIIDPLGLLKENGEQISIEKGKASAIMNHKKDGNSPKEIKKNANRVEHHELIGMFEKLVIPCIYNQNIDDLIAFFQEVIDNDQIIAPAKKKELKKLLNRNTLGELLGELFLLSLRPSNIYKDTDSSNGTSRNIQPPTRRSLLDLVDITLPKPTVPEKIVKSENVYVSALMSVYGQKHHMKSFTRETLRQFPKDYNNFEEHRRCYFAAELVRHEVQDINDGEDFNELEDEIQDGIREVYDGHYLNGEMRLTEVMKKVVDIRLEGCRLGLQTPLLIKNCVRKGVCHSLVNEGKLLGWVRDDDAEAV